jgi:hypothetical protein
MGYDCEAAINFSIDAVESQKLDASQNSILEKILEYLRNNDILIKKDYLYNTFFESLYFDNSLFTDLPDNIEQHPKLGKRSAFKGSYALEQYVFDYDIYLADPVEALELYIFSFYVSKHLPESKIKLGMGDAGYFWSDIEILNGELLSYGEEEDDDGEETWGFRSNELEINELFLGLNYQWMLSQNMGYEVANAYFQKKYTELANNLFSNYTEDVFFWLDEEEILSFFEQTDISLRENEAWMLTQIEYNTILYNLAPDHFKSDRAFALSALHKNVNVFLHLKEEFRKDKEFITYALEMDEEGEITAYIEDNS